jgi:hypothetical protein
MFPPVGAFTAFTAAFDPRVYDAVHTTVDNLEKYSLTLDLALREKWQTVRRNNPAMIEAGLCELVIHGASDNFRLTYERVAAISRPAAAEMISLRHIAMTALTAWMVLAGFILHLLVAMKAASVGGLTWIKCTVCARSTLTPWLGLIGHMRCPLALRWP